MLWPESLCALRNSYVEILIPYVMVLRNRALGEVLRSWWCNSLMKGINIFYKRNPTELPGPFHCVRTQQGVDSLKPAESLHQNWTMLAPWTQTFSFWNSETEMLFLSHPVCGVLFSRVSTLRLYTHIK